MECRARSELQDELHEGRINNAILFLYDNRFNVIFDIF